MQAKRPNTEDGGPSDWFNDTKPMIQSAIDKLRYDLTQDRAVLQRWGDASALEAPAAPMTTAEACAALAINSALHRIRAGNAAGAIEPLEPAAPGRLDDGMEMRCHKCGAQATIAYNSARIVTHNKHTGKPRDERDIASDPEGRLIVAPGPLPAATVTEPAAPAVDALAPVQALLDMHAELLDANPYAYFELAYTRQTGWMAWITDKPFHGPVINPDRKVLARGQGDTAAAACAAAAQAKEGGA
jgi:hypothetical protein